MKIKMIKTTMFSILRDAAIAIAIYLIVSSIIFNEKTSENEENQSNQLAETVCRYSIAHIFNRAYNDIKTEKKNGIVYLEYTRWSDKTVWRTKCKLVGENKILWASNNPGDSARWRNGDMDSKVSYTITNGHIIISEKYPDGSNSTRRYMIE